MKDTDASLENKRAPGGRGPSLPLSSLLSVGQEASLCSSFGASSTCPLQVQGVPGAEPAELRGAESICAHVKNALTLPHLLWL